MDGLKRMNNSIYSFTKNIAIVMFIGMLVLSMLQVFCRYVLKISLSFTEELARFLFIWVTFLGTAMALKKNQHVCMELLLEQLPATARKVIELVGTITSAVIYLIMIWSGYVVVSKTMRQTSAALNLPMGLVYAVVPVCGILMLLFLLEGKPLVKEGSGGDDL